MLTDALPRDPSSFQPLRREDPDLLTGQACFVHDVVLDGMAHVAFARSSVAHGRLRGLDTDAARRCPGVVAVFTAQDVGERFIPAINPLLPLRREHRMPLLAMQTVDYAGQPLAIVVAQTRAQARAAAEAVQADIEALPPCVDFATDEALTEVQHSWDAPDASDAPPAVRVQACMTSPRVLAMAMEPRAMAVQVDAAQATMTVWAASQSPSRVRTDVAAAVGLDVAQVRVITPQVGGAFGSKASVCAEDLLVPWAAWRLQRSLRWAATRSEEFAAGMQGRGSVLQGTLECDASGRWLGLQAELDFTLGAWLPFSAVVPLRNAARILPGPYHVQRLRVSGQAGLSHAAPINIYRGAGRPEAALLMETLVEMAARQLGIDPVELRRRNLVRADEMPYRTPTGETFDAGDYVGLLDQACERFGYTHERAWQAQRRAQGECVGIGVALYVEPCGQGWESARVTLHTDGRVEVASGSPAQGQGHLTTFARIAAEALGVSPEQVHVVCGDTAQCPVGVGALASRSIAIGGSAIVQACREALRRRDSGEAGPIVVDTRFESAESWSSGCVIVRLRVDIETGQPRIERVVWVDDAGRIIHPELAHGQLVGGFAQGMGQALMERIVYDADGQLLTGSLMDYAVPRAEDMPDLEIDSRSTASTVNLLGSKGVGEAGCIGVPAAILNAARDALSPWGEVSLDLPLRPERVWQVLQTPPVPPVSSPPSTC